MYTSHGHQIVGTDVEGTRPTKVARCGGSGLCTQCSREASAEHYRIANNSIGDK